MRRVINIRSFFWRMDRPLLACLLTAFIISSFGGISSYADDLISSTNLPPADAANNSPQSSVVQIFSTVRYPSPFKPWTKEPPSEISGSGVVISGKRILTCAHIVEYASRIQIQDNQGGGRLNVQVEAIAPDMDLAILKPEVEAFFDTHPEIKISHTLPDIRDSVLTYGYPVGGNSLSLTKGIVSRIEFAAYNYPAAGLRIQIDAAINPGNSGGPAVVDGKMIGLAFSYLNGTQNIGFIVPSEEIELFLKDIADGRYDGKPSLFGEYQTLANSIEHSFLKLDQTTDGLIIEKPDNDDPAYPLKKWDVITRIGETPLDSMGTVKLNDNVRVFFKYMVQRIVTNGAVPLTVIRDGKEQKISVPVTSSRQLVISGLNGTYPSYFVYGPLVFTPATMEFVAQAMAGQRGGNLMGILGYSGSSLVRRMGDQANFEGEQLVVVPCPLFPHQLSLGYSDPSFQVVKSVNGIPVKNLAQLVQILRDSKSEYTTFEFDVHNGQIIILPRAEVNSATEEILTDNDIRSQGSPDMLSIWNSK
jgi:S1-C subfamily serine protease